MSRIIYTDTDREYPKGRYEGAISVTKVRNAMRKAGYELVNELVFYHERRYAVLFKNGLPCRDIDLLRRFRRDVSVKHRLLRNEIFGVAIGHRTARKLYAAELAFRVQQIDRIFIGKLAYDVPAVPGGGGGAHVKLAHAAF